MIPALVLTAGLATRLRPLSLVRAKAALPVAGEPLVGRILHWLRGVGITDCVLNLHHSPETLTRIVGDGQDFGVRVRYSWETPVLGSAGGPKRAAPILGASRFLVVNGDTLTPFDVSELIAHHERTGALVTMAAVPNVEPDKYSGLLVGPGGELAGVARRGSNEPSFHYFGVQVVEAAAFESVPPDVPYESLKALYPALNAARPGAVRVMKTEVPYFFDIGTPLDYFATSMAWADREGTAHRHGAGTRIAANARIERTILWDHVTVDDGARLTGCIVTDGVVVPPRSTWAHQILRRLEGDLAPGETVIGDLAVSTLVGAHP
jgi:NDP-sugar pyrophosphorylase family protein